MAQQQILMPGIYKLDTFYTPLYRVPYQQFLKGTNAGAVDMQTIPLSPLKQWGTLYAIISLNEDSVSKTKTNRICFINYNLDSSAHTGYTGTQKGLWAFRQTDSTIEQLPDFDNSYLNYSDYTSFALWTNWFSIYTYPEIKSYSVTNANGYISPGSHIRIEAAGFDLYYNDTIISIRRNIIPDSIPIYQNKNDTNSLAGNFVPEEYIFIKKYSPNGLWMQVKKYQTSYEKGNSYRGYYVSLQNTVGWIRTEDLYKGMWVTDSNETKEYRFEVAGTDIDTTDHFSEPGMLGAIKIIDKKTGKLQQVITDIGAQLRVPLNRSLQFIDANFDGYKDIVTDYADGGAGPNYSMIFYLYNPATHQFEYHADLSSLSQPDVDTVKKIIHAAWRDGAAVHGAEDYTFKNGELQILNRWHQDWSSGYWAEETFDELRNGRWHTKIVYTFPIDTPQVYVYNTPVNGKVIDTLFKDLDYITTAGETALWYKIAADTFSRKKSGWVRKEDVYPAKRVPLQSHNKQYRFKYIPGDESGALAIVVYKTGSQKTWQIIGPIMEYEPEKNIRFTDVNHDEHTDIVTGSDDTEKRIFLYNAKSGYFAEKKLSEKK